MKYYYGDSFKDALANEPVEIKSTKTLEQYQEMYWVVIPASEVKSKK